MMSDGRSEWPVCQGGRGGPRYLLIERLAMGARDALMVSGFDILGQNRTLQVHWTKRIVAFALDCVVVLAPVWTVLFRAGVQARPAYGTRAGEAVGVSAPAGEAMWRRTVG